jgi:hypothetical protein
MNVFSFTFIKCPGRFKVVCALTLTVRLLPSRSSLLQPITCMTASMADNDGSANMPGSRTGGKFPTRGIRPKRAMGQGRHGGTQSHTDMRRTDEELAYTVQWQDYVLPMQEDKKAQPVKTLNKDEPMPKEILGSLSRKQPEVEIKPSPFVELLGLRLSGPEPAAQRQSVPGVSRDLATYLRTRNQGVAIPTSACRCEFCFAYEHYLNVSIITFQLLRVTTIY